jgi:hypothetical protein
MKPLAIAILLMSLSFTALSQQEETLLGPGHIDFGGFGGPLVQLTGIQGEFGCLVGGYGAFLINHRFAIGAGGYGLVNDIKASSEAHRYYQPSWDMYLELGYGGVVLEYIYNPNAVIHGSARVLIGGGAVDYRYDRWDNYGNYHDYDRPDVPTDKFFVVEPTLNVEMNITTWMRVQAGASYRYVSGIDQIHGIKDSDLSGASGVVTFKFGAF